MVQSQTTDPFGNITSTVELTYDKLNRILRETVNGMTMAKEYDPAGNVTQRTYPSGKSYQHTYDGLDRLTRISEQELGQVFNASYAGLSKVSRHQFGNGMETQFGYDAVKRLVSLRTAAGGEAIPLFAFTYGYDKAGNRLFEEVESAADLAPGAIEGEEGTVYTYDSLHRLVSARHGVADPAAEIRQPNSQPYSVLNEWELDGVDNWLQRVVSLRGAEGNEAISRAQVFHPNEVNEYISIDGNNLVYDSNGNLIEDAIHRYQYNYRNLLTRVVNKADATEVASYGYDALGRRISKTVEGQMIQYAYEGVETIAERAPNGLLREYVYGAGLDDLIAMVIPGPWAINSQAYYYHKDVQGSAVVLTDGQGEPVEKYQYDAYGDVKIYDAGTGALMEESAVGNPYLYTGQRFDPETGFYYYKARYYHPALGRFLQRDPLGYVDGYNLYSYVNNNPVNWVDPMGHYKIFFPAIHEKMTIEAINRAGGEARDFQSNFVGGVRSNDIPDGLPMSSYNFYLQRQGTITYETHFGSKQYWHFMKSGNESAQQVLEKVLSQSKEWYTTSMEYKHRAEDNQGPNRSLFENIYTNNSMGLSAFNVAHIAHIIQDFYSGGHVRRDPNDGSILEIYDYKNQDHGAHGGYDKGYSSEAVDATAKLIDLWNNNADWSEVRNFLQRIFKIKESSKKKK